MKSGVYLYELFVGFLISKPNVLEIQNIVLSTEDMYLQIDVLYITEILWGEKFFVQSRIKHMVNRTSDCDRSDIYDPSQCSQ